MSPAKLQYNWPGVNPGSPEHPMAVRHSNGKSFGPIPVEGVGAFGDLITAPIVPIIQADFVYGGHPDLVEEHTSGTGSVAYTDSMLVVSSGANQGGRAFVHSRRLMRYRPGQGALFRFIAKFSAPVLGVAQNAGLYNGPENAIFVGYDPEDSQLRFGVNVQSFGARDVHTLTITDAPTGAESLTVTLDGTPVVVTLSSGTTAEAAQEVAETTFAGWTVEADGVKVHFLADDAEPREGTYSVSGDGDGDGTLAQDSAGAVVANDWHYQENWNHDSFDGDGPSGADLDFTKLNVYEILYLGVGAIDLYIEDPATGHLILADQFHYANIKTRPSVSDPDFSMGCEVFGVDAGSDLSVSMVNFAGFVEGKRHIAGPHHGADSDGNVSSSTPVLSVRCNKTFTGGVARANFRELLPTLLEVSASASNKPLKVEVILNPVLVDPLWVDFDEMRSFAALDESATACTGGTLILATGFSSGQGVDRDLVNLDLVLEPGDFITVVIIPTGNAADFIASLSWREDA